MAELLWPIFPTGLPRWKVNDATHGRHLTISEENYSHWAKMSIEPRWVKRPSGAAPFSEKKSADEAQRTKNRHSCASNLQADETSILKDLSKILEPRDESLQARAVAKLPPILIDAISGTTSASSDSWWTPALLFLGANMVLGLVVILCRRLTPTRKSQLD